jgi:Suppressor of fused protein (SUFU)
MARLPTPIRYLETITKHVRRNFGTDAFVLHEDKSSTVHVDLHVVPPNHSRPYFTLLTSGMSDLDMHVPAGLNDLALAEVCLCLPGDWPLSTTDFGWRKPEYFWPIALLQQTARYVHREKTWFSRGHTVEHSAPVNSAGRFTGIMLLIPQTFLEGLNRVTTEEDGRTIHFLAVVPLLPQEMQFAQEQGSDALEERLNDAGVTELLNPQRPSAV